MSACPSCNRTFSFDGVRVTFRVEGDTLRGLTLPRRVPAGFNAGTLRRILREASRYRVGSGGAPEFTRRVWDRLRRIPPGRTMSYGELAAAIGRPGASRAVGAACAANPLLLVVPCHRVVAADGGLGGFALGLAWKRRLLEIEREPADGSKPRVSSRVSR